MAATLPAGVQRKPPCHLPAVCQSSNPVNVRCCLQGKAAGPAARGEGNCQLCNKGEGARSLVGLETCSSTKTKENRERIFGRRAEIDTGINF